MEDISFLVKQHNPKNIQTDFLRDETAKSWGYDYLQDSKLRGEAYTHRCVSCLNEMEAKIAEICKDGKIAINQRDQGGLEISDKEIVAKETAFGWAKKIFGWSRSHSQKCLDMFDDPYADVPTQQRLIVFDYGGKREVSFSVSTNRFLKSYMGGGNNNWREEGFSSMFLGQMLPILVRLYGFAESDENYREINRQLKTADFRGIRRDFPT